MGRRWRDDWMETAANDQQIYNRSGFSRGVRSISWCCDGGRRRRIDVSDHTLAVEDAAFGLQAPFEPAVFDISRKFQLNGPANLACPYFEPQWRNLIADWWDLETLVEPEGDTLNAGVYRVTHGSDIPPILLYVHGHIPERMRIRYSIIYQSVEVEKYHITCEPDGDDTAKVTVRVIIMGMNEYGNRAVTEYVEKEQLVQVIDAYRDAINERLE